MSTQAQITVLNYPDNVRKRKEMYLTDANHCLFEIVDNCVDEHSAGFATNISVQMTDDCIVVADNGRGIPVTPCKDPDHVGLSQAEVAFTVLHAGGKFGTKSGYQTATGGLHGVGASCVNAVSEFLHLEIHCDGQAHAIDFAKGLITEKLHVLGPSEATGTIVQFKLDKEIWKEEVFDVKKIQKRLRQLAYLNPGLEISFASTMDEANIEETYCFPDGLKSYANRVLQGKTVISDIFHSHVNENDIDVAFAYAYTDGFSTELISFCNNIATEAGGDHQIGFYAGVSKAIERYGLEAGLMKTANDITAEDSREGLVGIISVKVKEPKFEGQGKSKIKMPEVRGVVKKIVEDYFFDALCQDDTKGKAILDQVMLAAKARSAAKRARDAVRKTKEAFDTSGLSGKLSDCQSRNAEESEIFLVEGDSAGGSARQGRDRKTQAILPVFGKILNVEKSRIDKVVASPKIMEIVKSLRCGIGPDFDLKKLRYHKIVLLADADEDGGHIQSLIITFFYRYMRELIDNGYLYAAVPPLYKVAKGKEITYLYSREELEATDTTGCNVQRYKGLGEMNPEQLWDTTMNPQTRKLIQIVIEDAEASEIYLSTCMGDDVATRYQFIMDSLSGQDEASA